MSYNDVAALAADTDFRVRIAACYSTERPTSAVHPLTWADLYQYTIAGAPGFGDAYASALAGNVENPGKDEGVITDAMLLGAVQGLLSELEADPEPQGP
jgi:hypothetical protein